MEHKDVLGRWPGARMNEQIEQFRDRIFPADSESLEEKIISIRSS